MSVRLSRFPLSGESSSPGTWCPGSHAHPPHSEQPQPSGPCPLAALSRHLLSSLSCVPAEDLWEGGRLGCCAWGAKGAASWEGVSTRLETRRACGCSESLLSLGFLFLRPLREEDTASPQAEDGEAWSLETQVRPQSTACLVCPSCPWGGMSRCRGTASSPASPASVSPCSLFISWFVTSFLALKGIFL